jgi:hypothetical protein
LLPSSSTTAAADVAETTTSNADAMSNAMTGFLSSFAVIMSPSSFALFDDYI